MFFILKREKEFLIYFGLKYAFASIFAKNHTKSVKHNLEPNYSEKEEEDEDVLVYQASWYTTILIRPLQISHGKWSKSVN